MNSKELRALADKLDEENKPKKKGFLKFDLYNFNFDYRQNVFEIENESGFWLHTLEEKENLIASFKGRFEQVLKAGAEFTCYIRDGEEEWHDNENYGVESMNENWAEKYLENIHEIN